MRRVGALLTTMKRGATTPRQWKAPPGFEVIRTFSLRAQFSGDQCEHLIPFFII